MPTLDGILSLVLSLKKWLLCKQEIFYYLVCFNLFASYSYSQNIVDYDLAHCTLKMSVREK